MQKTNPKRLGHTFHSVSFRGCKITKWKEVKLILLNRILSSGTQGFKKQIQENTNLVTGNRAGNSNHQLKIPLNCPDKASHAPIKILYVTRNFNHSGFKILKTLIHNKFNIVAVVLKNEFSWHGVPILRHFARILYWIECHYYRCRPLKNMNSEELFLH